MTFKTVLNKIKVITLSRFKKNQTGDWVEERRNICAPCEYNSKNKSKIVFYKKILIKFSDLYSYITGNTRKDNLGNCTYCESCSIFYKTQEPYEECEAGKWKAKV